MMTGGVPLWLRKPPCHLHVLAIFQPPEVGSIVTDLDLLAAAHLACIARPRSRSRTRKGNSSGYSWPWKFQATLKRFNQTHHWGKQIGITVGATWGFLMVFGATTQATILRMIEENLTNINCIWGNSLGIAPTHQFIWALSRNYTCDHMCRLYGKEITHV